MPTATLDAPTEALRRYRLLRTFGDRKRGEIAPRWWLANSGDVDEMVARKMVEETFDAIPSNQRPFAVPDGVPQMANPPAEMVERESELVVQLAGANSEIEVLRGAMAEVKLTLAAREQSMAKLSDAHNAAEAKSLSLVKQAQKAEQDAKIELKKAMATIAELQKNLAALREPATAPKG